MPRRPTPWPAVAAWAAFVVAAFAASSNAATSSTVVAADVPSAISISDGCGAPEAYRLGPLLPGDKATTATGAGVCSISFSSSNDSAMLQVVQRDRVGAAMTSPTTSWASAVAGDSSSFARVHAIDSNTVVATGTQVQRSADGGTTWEILSVPGLTYARGLAVDPGNGDEWFLAGADGLVLRTSGGRAASPTWTDLTTQLLAAGWPSSVDVRDVSVGRTSTSRTVFLVGQDRWLATSTDGGSTWSAFQHADTGVGWMHAVEALSATHAIGVGDSGVVLHTTTGGGTAGAWTRASTPNGCYLWDVSYPSSTRAYAASDCGVWVYDGTSWAQRGSTTLGAAVNIMSVDSTSAAPDTVVAGGRDGIAFWSTNAGGSFQRRHLPSAEHPGGVAIVGSETDVVWAGSGLAILRTANAGISWSERSARAVAVSLAGVSAAPADGRRVLAAGSRGTVQRSTDGGATWATPVSGTSAALFGVDFATDDVAWAVGSGGTVLRSDDGGASWSPQSSGTTERLFTVRAVDRHTAYAVGANGTLSVTRNGGSSWSSQVIATADLRGVAALPGGVVVAVGEFDTMRRSTDGGATFSVIAGSPAGRFTDIDEGPNGSLLASAQSPSGIWRSTDQGLTWTVASTSSHTQSFSVVGDAWYRGGVYGEIRRSMDGGATQQSFNIGGWVNDVHAVDPSTAFVVGRGSVIRRTSPSIVAAASVMDAGAAPADWASATGSMFGVCLQAVSAATVADWTIDATGIAGQCEAVDTDPWRAIPTTPERVGRTTAAGQVGRVDVVWGFRPAADQLPGVYTAGVTFQAIAPAA